MRRLLTGLAVSLGIAELVRRLRRSSAPDASAREAPDPAPEGDPADELRRKLAASRVDEPAAASAPPLTVEERRAEVHDQGRSALDDMREGDEG